MWLPLGLARPSLRRRLAELVVGRHYPTASMSDGWPWLPAASSPADWPGSPDMALDGTCVAEVLAALWTRPSGG